MKILIKNKFVSLTLFFLVLIANIDFVNAQELRNLENNAFQKGEYLKYRVFYDSFLTGGITAGEAEFQVHKESRSVAKRNTMHIEVNGVTKGVFNLFFKVRDRYETFIDEETLAPWLFIRRVNEGGYTIEQDVSFNQFNNTSLFKDVKRNRSNTSSTPPYIHDLLSAIYFFRTIDMTDAKIGDDYSVMFSLDDTVYTTQVLYLGKEDIKTSLGTFRCIKIKPVVLTGTVFKDPYPVTVWITDDKNKMPILAKSEILVGSVKFELVKYKDIKNPLLSRLR